MGRVIALTAVMSFLVGTFFATFSDMKEFLPPLLEGSIITVKITLMSAVLFYAMALIAGLAKTSSYRLMRWTSTFYIEIFRGTSLLVQLFWFFYVLPEFGISLSPTVAAVLALGLNYGAYGAEVVRGGFNAVDKGQWEACTALNMSWSKKIHRIIFPQAFIVMIPSFGNLTIEMIKSTALVSAVTLVDITYAAVQQNQLYFRTLEIFSVSLLLYYCAAQIIRFGTSYLEERSTRHLRGRA